MDTVIRIEEQREDYSKPQLMSYGSVAVITCGMAGGTDDGETGGGWYYGS